MFHKIRARLRLRRTIPTMTHREAFRELRKLAYGGSTDIRTQRLLVERAIATAPDEEGCYQAEAWARPLRAGRLIKQKNGGKLTALEGASVELIDAVDEIYDSEVKE